MDKIHEPIDSIKHKCDCTDCREYMAEMVSIKQFHEVVVPTLNKLLDEKLETKTSIIEKVEKLHRIHWPVTILGETVYTKHIVDMIIYIIVLIIFAVKMH